MTLGGLALAVGILVDDATVDHREHRAQSGTRARSCEQAILDGAAQIAVPAFVSTLCICIVFVPMFFLTGVARFLFVPLAEAVVFAMLASYILSRTLVPTLVMYIMRGHEHREAGGQDLLRPLSARLSSAASTSSAAATTQLLETTLRHRKLFAACSWPSARLPLLLLFIAGPGFLPQRRRRPDPAAHARRDRHADRGNRAAVR